MGDGIENSLKGSSVKCLLENCESVADKCRTIPLLFKVGVVVVVVGRLTAALLSICGATCIGSVEFSVGVDVVVDVVVGLFVDVVLNVVVDVVLFVGAAILGVGCATGNNDLLTCIESLDRIVSPLKNREPVGNKFCAIPLLLKADVGVGVGVDVVVGVGVDVVGRLTASFVIGDNDV